MQNYHFGKYRVEVDQFATANWYAKSDGWGCECAFCRNFLKLAKRRDLPVHILEILDELDLSPEKATYVCKLDTEDAGIRYQFSYRIAGTIVDSPSEEDTQNWDEVRCWHDSYPYGAPGFPEPHFDLEFIAVLPWLFGEVQGY